MNKKLIFELKNVVSLIAAKSAKLSAPQCTVDKIILKAFLVIISYFSQTNPAVP